MCHLIVLGPCGCVSIRGLFLKWLFKILSGLMPAGSMGKARALKLMRLRFYPTSLGMRYSKFAGMVVVTFV